MSGGFFFCEKPRNLNKIQSIKVRFKTIPSSSIVALLLSFVLHSDTSLQSFCDFFIALYIFFCLMLLQMINEWHFFSSNERGRKMIIKMFFLFSSSLFWYFKTNSSHDTETFFSPLFRLAKRQWANKLRRGSLSRCRRWFKAPLQAHLMTKTNKTKNLYYPSTGKAFWWKVKNYF